MNIDRFILITSTLILYNIIGYSFYYIRYAYKNRLQEFSKTPFIIKLVFISIWPFTLISFIAQVIGVTITHMTEIKNKYKK